MPQNMVSDTIVHVTLDNKYHEICSMFLETKVFMGEWT